MNGRQQRNVKNRTFLITKKSKKGKNQRFNVYFRFRNLAQKADEAPSKKNEPKFNHVGERLKKADCTTGEIITKDKNAEEPEE